jgi:hypothetical protein
MNPAQDDPPVSECSLHHCGSSVGIPADSRAPTGKLRAVLPILIERWCSGTGNRHGCLAYASGFSGIEMELHARGQIQAVIRRIPGKETARTDSEVVQAVLYRLSNVRGSRSSQILADVDEISAWDDQQTAPPELHFAHPIQTCGIRGGIDEMVALQDRLDGRDIIRRGALPGEQENRREVARLFLVSMQPARGECRRNQEKPSDNESGTNGHSAHTQSPFRFTPEFPRLRAPETDRSAAPSGRADRGTDRDCSSPASAGWWRGNRARLRDFPRP